jgi:2-dehydro-3-deoxygluconokinase
VDNEIGHLIEDFIMQGGVDTEFIKWREDDGIGRSVRNGLNFTERGFGIRGAVGNPDRGNSAASQLKPGDYDWDHIFGQLGARWFHTGGIFAALSESAAQITIEAVTAAKTISKRGRATFFFIFSQGNLCFAIWVGWVGCVTISGTQ